jgi:uncharacterized protein YqjF (DUF2071 family)
MKIPVIKGVMERRILANYHVEPEVIARLLPRPFRPKLAHGKALAGICLIRLAGVRPKFLPLPWGIRSENAAHRIAVEWEADGKLLQGVYIPRRDTSSRLNTWAGGTVFPGVHNHAQFAVQETPERVSVSVVSDDHSMRLHFSGVVAKELPRSSVFENLAEASQFFAEGSLGYSVTRDAGRYDGLELRCSTWQVEPLEIEGIESTFFDDRSKFPKGSLGFYCALLMRNIKHEWHGRSDLCC